MLKLIKDSLKNLLLRIEELLLRENYDSKVFCIGYNKTGTTSLGKSLHLLGLKHSSFNRRVWRKLYLKGKINEVIKYTAKFEALDDLPWLKEDMIPILDKTFPNSKFIYLERDEESWKKSYANWTFNVLGYSEDAESEWYNYLKHQDFVLNYFTSRDKDFIVLDIRDKEGFKKLADFLGKKPLHNHFPRFNKS